MTWYIKYLPYNMNGIYTDKDLINDTLKKVLSLCKWVVCYDMPLDSIFLNMVLLWFYRVYFFCYFFFLVLVSFYLAMEDHMIYAYDYVT